MRKFVVALFLASAASLLAGDYTTLDIRVNSAAGRPIEDASVVIRFAGDLPKVKPSKRFRKEWDVKTDQKGEVKLPTIPKGYILIQVRADNYQTYGKTFLIDQDQKEVDIKLNPPQPQYSDKDKGKGK